MLMILTPILNAVQTVFYAIVKIFFQTIARLFGYPENGGMPWGFSPDPSYNSGYDFGRLTSARLDFLEKLPVHLNPWTLRSESWFEIFFGPIPRLNLITKHYTYPLKSENDDFYHFYIENYRNMYFLPDWFSEFLQLKCNIVFDTTVLDNMRLCLFIILMIYCQMISIRISLAWFLSVNPFRFPWSFFSGAVDWADELLLGILPTVFGLNITANVVGLTLGAVADNLNHLVLTMPYLPSEGIKQERLVDSKMTEVIVFNNIPTLWTRSGTFEPPKELKKLWYEKNRLYYDTYYGDTDFIELYKPIQ